LSSDIVDRPRDRLRREGESIVEIFRSRRRYSW
jgi:hypothetical protein